MPRSQNYVSTGLIDDAPEIEEERSSSRFSLVKGDYLPSRKFNKEKFETLGIDAETRKILMDAEYYHYLIIQLRWNTIVSFLIGIFGLAVCIVCYLSMDYQMLDEYFGWNFTPSPFLKQYAFACSAKDPHFWDMEDPNNKGFPNMRAEGNFTCQVIYVYLFSTLQLIVLSTIPYRYDRFAKTETEQKIDKQKQLKEMQFLQFKLEHVKWKQGPMGRSMTEVVPNNSSMNYSLVEQEKL